MVSIFSPRLVTLLTVGFLASARAYTMRTQPIYEVPAADRVSDTQLFAREVDILTDTQKFPSININIDSPGRVFITYVENATALSTPASVGYGTNITTYGKIKVSGSSRGIVSYLDFTKSQSYITDTIDIVTDYTQSYSNTDSLLVEFTLYAKQSLKRFKKYGTSDAVILENVMYTPHNVSEDTKLGMGSFVTLGSGNGSIFIHDPTAVIAMDEMVISALDITSGAIQIELGGLNITNNIGISIAGFPHPVTLIADQVSPITLSLDKEPSDGSPLCIASKNDVTVDTKPLFASTTVKTGSSVRSKGTTCTKLPLPERKPAPVDAKAAAEAAKTSAPAAKSAAASERGLGEISVAVSSLAAVVLAATQ